MKNLKYVLLLLLASFIWGTAFLAQSKGMDHVGPYTFVATRNILGVLVLIPVLLVMNKKGEMKSQLPKEVERKKLLIGGILCGLFLFLGSCLQQFGMCYTTVGKAGFITALYIIFVPVVSIFLKKPAGIQVWLGVALATVGLYLLCMVDSLSLSVGDTFVFLCALGFTGHILMVDHFSMVHAVKLSMVQFGVCAILGTIFMFIFEHPTWNSILAGGTSILYAGIMSSGVAYTLQVVAQKKLPATLASLLMSFESVFALLTGMVVLGQIPTAREGVGSVFMFVAIILAQLPGKSEKNEENA